MKKIFTFLFAAILVTMFSAFALADANLNLVASTTTMSAAPLATATASFSVNNTNTTTTLTNLAYTVTVSGFTPTSATCSLPVSVLSNTSQSASVSVGVPQYTLPGSSYTVTVNVSGNLTGLVASAVQTFILTVPSTPALSVTWMTSPSEMYQGQSQTVRFNVTNTGNVILNTVNVTLDTGAKGLTANESSWILTDLNYGASTTRSLKLTASETAYLGSRTLTLTANGVNSLNSSLTASATSTPSFNLKYPYCENVSNMTASPISYQVKNSDKIDGETFDPLEEIKVEVKVWNNDPDDSHYAIVEAVLMQDGSEVGDTNTKKKMKIAEDDSATFKLNMTVPADVSAGDAYVYITAYNDDESTNCQQVEYRVTINKEDKSIALEDMDYPTAVSCGDTFTVSGKLINIGTSDEDKVLVSLNAFKTVQEQDMGDLNEGEDSSLFSFDVKVPANATEGTNQLAFTVSYDYDDDDGTYGESSSFSYATTVSGCKKLEPDVTVKTEVSTAITSTESEVRFLVTNPTAVSQTYTITASADWATVSSVSPASVTLDAGKQQYVTVKLTPNKDTSIGSHDLIAKVTYGSKTTDVKVPVSVQKASTSSGLLDQLAFQFKYNTAWALLDTLLVVAIIVILVLIFVRKK